MATSKPYTIAIRQELDGGFCSTAFKATPNNIDRLGCKVTRYFINQALTIPERVGKFYIAIYRTPGEEEQQFEIPESAFVSICAFIQHAEHCLNLYEGFFDGEKLDEA